MKNIFFIFHQRAAYAVDWKSLVKSDNSDNLFIMVTNAECYRELSAEDRSYFNDIISVTSFEFNELVPKMDAYFKDHYQPTDQVRIAVLSEFTMTVAAQIRDHFKHQYTMVGPGQIETAFFRDKRVMKELLGKAGVRIPKYEIFHADEYLAHPARYIEQMSKHLGFPMFAKPIDSGGSIGTQFIGTQQDLIAWSTQAAKDSKTTYEVDEFIDGELFHCDSIIKNGKPIMTFANRYLHPNADARSGKALASMTMSKEDKDYPGLMKFAEEVLRQFKNIPDGFTHMEIFNKRGELIFLEIAARPPGAKAPEVFKIRTGGIDMRWMHLRLNLGLSVEHQLAHLADDKNWGPYAAMSQVVAPAKGGVITRLQRPVYSGGQQVFQCTAKVGDLVEPNKSILDTVCSSVFSNGNYSQLKDDFMNLDQQRIVATSEPSESNFPVDFYRPFNSWFKGLTPYGISRITSPQEKDSVYITHTAWDCVIKRYPTTGEPVYTHRAYNGEAEVGTVSFYKHPYICRSADRERHNIIATTGMFAGFEDQIFPYFYPECAAMPPTFMERISASAVSGARTGFLKGATNGLELTLRNKGYSYSDAMLLSQACFYASYGVMKFGEYYSMPSRPEDEISAILSSIMLAAVDTGSMMVISVAQTIVTMLLMQASHLLESNQWHKSASTFKSVAKLVQFGLFAYANQQSIAEAGISLVAGSATQLAVESIIELNEQKPSPAALSS